MSNFNFENLVPFKLWTGADFKSISDKYYYIISDVDDRTPDGIILSDGYNVHPNCTLDSGPDTKHFGSNRGFQILSEMRLAKIYENTNCHFIRKVKFPDDCLVYVGHNAYITDKLILGEIELVDGRRLVKYLDPNVLFDENLMLRYIQIQPELLNSLNVFSLSDTFIEKCLHGNIHAAEHINQDRITKEHARIITQHSNSRLEYIPERFLCKNIYLLFLQHNNDACRYLNEVIGKCDLNNINALVVQTVLQDVKQLRRVHTKLLNNDVLEEILCVEPTAIFYLPKRFITRSRWYRIVYKFPHLIKDLPAKYSADLEFYDEKLITQIIHVCPQIIHKLPVGLRTRDFYLRTVRRHGNFLPFVPKDFLTKDLYLAALLDGQCKIEYVPFKYLTQAVIIDAAFMNARYIKYISNENNTKELREQLDAQYRGVGTPRDFMTLYRLNKLNKVHKTKRRKVTEDTGNFDLENIEIYDSHHKKI